MLTASINKIGHHKEIVHFYKSGSQNFKIGVLNSYGAALNRIEIPFQNKTFNLVQGYNRVEDFSKGYLGVLLAPFPNRVKNGQYNFEDKTYQLPINRPKENNALHGFLYNQPFTIIENSIINNTSTIKIKNDYDGRVEGYPFNFKTTVTYKWNAPYELKTSIEIENTGIKQMPLGLGWHPYFQFPQSVNNVALEMDTINKFLVDKQMIPTLKTEAFTAFKQSTNIEETNFDDCFELNKSNPIHQTTLTDKLNNISLVIKQDVKTFGYLQVYTPPTRDAIAVEPMTCIPNAFNNQVGLKQLKPNNMYEVSYSINLKLGKAQ